MLGGSIRRGPMARRRNGPCARRLVRIETCSPLGVAVSDAELPAQATQTERAYGGEAKVLTLLKGEGLTMALYKRTLESQMLTQAVATKGVAKARVSGAQIKAYGIRHATTLRKSKKTATLAPRGEAGRPS